MPVFPAALCPYGTVPGRWKRLQRLSAGGGTINLEALLSGSEIGKRVAAAWAAKSGVDDAAMDRSGFNDFVATVLGLEARARATGTTSAAHAHAQPAPQPTCSPSSEVPSSY